MPKVDFKRVETDEEIENIEIIDGQLIYSKSGKTFMDYGNERIPTGSGGNGRTEEVVISSEEPTTEDWKIWINPDEPINNIGSEVVDNLDGNEKNMAPSVNTVNNALNELKEYVLYDNSTGIKTDVTLSDSAENYDYLEIFARSNDKIYVNQKVYKPNSKEVLLIASYPYSSGVTYMKMTSYSINGNVISPKNYCELALGPTISNGNSNNLYIVRVIGYKEV